VPRSFHTINDTSISFIQNLPNTPYSHFVKTPSPSTILPFPPLFYPTKQTTIVVPPPLLQQANISSGKKKKKEEKKRKKKE